LIRCARTSADPSEIDRTCRGSDRAGRSIDQNPIAIVGSRPALCMRSRRLNDAAGGGNSPRRCHAEPYIGSAGSVACSD
jgi:hypothetical protein